MATYLRVPVALENTILLAPSQKPPPSPPAAQNEPRRCLSAPPRPTASTVRWIHLMRNSEAPGWCREASYRALWTVGGPSAVPATEGVLSDDFVAPAPACSDTRGNLRPWYRSFTPRLTRSREGYGRRRPHRRDRYATNQGSRGGGGGWWWWRSIRRPRSAAGGPPTHPPDGSFAARTRRVGAVLGGPLALAAPSPRPFDLRWAGTLFGQAG